MSRNTFLGMLVSVVNCGTVGTVQPDIRLMATMYSTFNGANERLVGNRAHTHTAGTVEHTAIKQGEDKQKAGFSIFRIYNVHFSVEYHTAFAKNYGTYFK